MAPDPLAELRSAVAETAAALGEGRTTQEPTLERPPKAELGDYSTNAAMLLAPTLGRAPREIAEDLCGGLAERLGERARRLEVAGPGFVNVFLADRWHRQATASILAAEPFGRAPPGSRDRALVEFVSANPTGPLTAASGRHAAYGDALTRVLEAAGHEVGREYYFNDAGGQVERFAASIAARMRGEEPPEDGYGGGYVAELGERLAAAGHDPDDLPRLGQAGVEAMMVGIRATLERFDVRFDEWRSERELHESGQVESVIAALREGGHVYESEGATWLRTSVLGDDKDRVLLRSGGEPTYFAADVAYHRDKLARGWQSLLDVVGADHHGYVARMRAAIELLGAEPSALEIVIMQLVHVLERGARSQMSKRKGDFVTLDELIEDIGVDAARFFLVQRSHDTTIDLDLDLARSQSQDNPVYYVQYAHARIAGILRKAREESGATASAAAAREREPLHAPCEPSERALVRRLLELPREIAGAAEKRSPHRLCAYAQAVAADFHAFYRDCRVVGADAEEGVAGLEAARLGLCRASMSVIAGTLELIGVSAPDRM